MSGVAGADRIKSRQDFTQFIAEYTCILEQFPGVKSITPSGSFQSNIQKQDFGDIDLIVHIHSTLDKSKVKQELVAFFNTISDQVLVPFSSAKHSGKKTYNAGELVTVRFHSPTLGYSVQIDNIVALSSSETEFKQQFLNTTAEKQGLMLGLVKIAAIETPVTQLFDLLDIIIHDELLADQEYEFNLSSVELQLRKVSYEPNSYKQIDKSVLWSSNNWNMVSKLLYQYNLDLDFDGLMTQTQQCVTNPRSGARIRGVFGSMITVKSGEVGTEKALTKTTALDKITQMFNTPNHIVFCFGRMNPPTLGHAEVFKTMKNIGGDYRIFLSRTQDKKDNPLSYDEKIQFIKLMYPEHADHINTDDTVGTVLQAANCLYAQGFKHVTFVAGSDRIDKLGSLLNQYNGTPGLRHGYYNFDTIQLKSSGQREDATNTVSGISGSMARKYARENNFIKFTEAVGNDKYSTTLFDRVRLLYPAI